MARSFEGDEGVCLNCGTRSRYCLSKDQLFHLSHAFFVRGSTIATEYGGAPAIQFNEQQAGSLTPSDGLKNDIELLQKTLGVGFFHYGPRFWMVGLNIEPLERLKDKQQRPAVVERIIREYPTVSLTNEEFYRVRKSPTNPADAGEYDAPPQGFHGTGRLDSPGMPVLYGSQDAEICVHEARFVASDELYIATLRPIKQLKLLDVSVVLLEDCTEFESLDIAVLMLFLAKSHSYEISRDIAMSAREAGFDGLIYPSYFSMLRTGGNPFETVYGLSTRRFDANRDYEQSKVIGNLALFGNPVAEQFVEVVSINRLNIEQVRYKMIFGPVVF